MVEVKLPEPDISSGKYTEYSFDKAEHFYDFLLNFNNNMKKKYPSNYPALDGQNRWVFRGHWDSSWALLPSAFREGWNERFTMKLVKTISNSFNKPQAITSENSKIVEIPESHIFSYQIIMEFTLLEKFMRTANDLGIECGYIPSFYKYYYDITKEYFTKSISDGIKNWPDPSLWPLMASAQHHGTPTRLLDFTYNPFFAAFFAASHPFFEEYIKKNKESEKCKRLCIWAFDEKAMTSGVSSMNDNLWLKMPASRNRFSNLFAQEGVLLLDTDANKRFIENGKEWQSFETMGEPDRLIKFTLPQSEYKELLRLLWEDDINPAKIKPNLNEVTQTIEYNQWLWVEI